MIPAKESAKRSTGLFTQGLDLELEAPPTEVPWRIDRTTKEGLPDEVGREDRRVYARKGESASD